MVWGGKFQNEAQVRKFEIVSIVINSFMILIIAIKGHYIRIHLPIKLINGILWFFVFLFALNTIGNLFAKTSIETMVFTPITFVSAILCYRIAKGLRK